MRTLEVEKNVSTVHTNGSIEQLRGSPKHADPNDMLGICTLSSIVPEVSSVENYTNQEVENGFNEIQVNLTSTPMRSISCEQLDISGLGSSIDLMTGTVYSSGNTSRDKKVAKY